LAVNYASFIFFGIFPGLFRVSKKTDVIFFFSLSPITSCLPAILMKWLLRKPLVIWVQDLWPESVVAVGASKNSLFLKLIEAIVHFIYSQCDLVLVQSQAFKQNLSRFQIPAEKIKYIPNWAQASSAHPKPADWLQQLPQGFKIIFAGNIGKAQSIDTIISAAEKTKSIVDLHWIFVGDGSEKLRLDKIILDKSLSATVHTYGRRPNEDMPGLFAQASALVVTLTDEPIFALTVPSKVQAYMSAGRPLLSAMNGEGNRIIELAQAGLTAAAQDAQKLAENAIQMYKLPIEQLLKMGANGQKYFLHNFEQSLVLNQIEDLLKSVVDRQVSK
jgi:glycosyltransferase involved in cell wall biosynthesis